MSLLEHARLGDLEAFKQEQEKEAYAISPDGLTPLLCALKNKHFNIVYYLLSDENPQKNKVVEFIDVTSKSGMSALFLAIQKKYFSVAVRLLMYGADPYFDGDIFDYREKLFLSMMDLFQSAALSKDERGKALVLLGKMGVRPDVVAEPKFKEAFFEEYRFFLLLSKF